MVKLFIVNSKICPLYKFCVAIAFIFIHNTMQEKKHLKIANFSQSKFYFQVHFTHSFMYSYWLNEIWFKRESFTYTSVEFVVLLITAMHIEYLKTYSNKNSKKQQTNIKIIFFSTFFFLLFCFLMKFQIQYTYIAMNWTCLFVYVCVCEFTRFLKLETCLRMDKYIYLI